MRTWRRSRLILKRALPPQQPVSRRSLVHDLHVTQQFKDLVCYLPRSFPKLETGTDGVSGPQLSQKGWAGPALLRVKQTASADSATYIRCDCRACACARKCCPRVIQDRGNPSWIGWPLLFCHAVRRMCRGDGNIRTYATLWQSAYGWVALRLYLLGPAAIHWP